MCVLFLIPESRGHRVYMSELICMIMCRLCTQGSKIVSCLNLFSDGTNLSSVASLETLYLTVRKRTTLSALSAIFSNSTIKDLHLNIHGPVNVSEG